MVKIMRDFIDCFYSWLTHLLFDADDDFWLIINGNKYDFEFDLKITVWEFDDE
jgi:GTPase SAR1 family protein